MANVQDGKETIPIRSLDDDIKLGKIIEDSAKKLLFELLQYTDGKPFKKATNPNEPPFITFRVYRDQIVVDCNDDGLSNEDLDVICQSVPYQQPSTEWNSFKSLVIATKKVHIQSRNFSLEFQPNMLEPYDGAMRPISVTPAMLLSDTLTRITLHLHDVQDLRRVILSQFETIQETSLLFLQRLRRIRIEMYDEGGKMEQSKDFRMQFVTAFRRFLRFSSIGEKEAKAGSQLYHVLGDSEKSVATSVVLAFPLTEEAKPDVARGTGMMFNIVPLRTLPYKFHIHADFDVDAERHDIDTTSTRNHGIRRFIMSVFIRNMFLFLQDPILQYYWPLFLPGKEMHYDSFWSPLDTDIRAWIGENPILRSRSLKQWRSIDHLTISTTDYEDKSGAPLFDDTTKDPFLSSEYPEAAVDALKGYGLKTLSASQFLSMVEADLDSDSSKMRGQAEDGEWQSAVARLLLKLSKSEPENMERIRLLRLLPLRNGTWTSMPLEPVYFDTTGGIDIPECLNIGMTGTIIPSAGFCSGQKDLYQHLGVEELAVHQVRKKILFEFVCGPELTPSTINSFLRFLYLTHEPGRDEGEQSYVNIRVLTMDEKLVNPQEEIVYRSGKDHAYTPESLLTRPESASPFRRYILEPAVVNPSPSMPRLFHPTWKQWLSNCLGIQDRLTILQPSPFSHGKSIERLFSTTDVAKDLSDHFLYVLNHQPEKFLGLFEYLWAFEKAKVLKSPALISKLRDLPAKNLCGVDFPLKLHDTWLPDQHLVSCVELYMEHPDQFPFLKLEKAGVNILKFGSKWDFLMQHFGVGWFMNMDFLLAILKSIKRSCTGKLSNGQIQKVFDLYAAISSKFVISDDEAKDRVLEFFEDSGVLYIDETGSTWTSTYCCLWGAPADMKSVCSLKSAYNRQCRDLQQRESLEAMFHKRLDIRDATVDNLVTELNILRDTGSEDVARITDIYRYLDEELILSEDVQRAFRETPLIFVKQDNRSVWCESSKCSWSEEKDKVIDNNLNDLFKGLKTFFLTKLGVRQSAYDMLLHLDSASTEKAKAVILSLIDDFHRSRVFFPEKLIPKGNFLPVRNPNGTLSLCSVDSEFAIGDRDRLVNRLRGKIKILDFNLAEVRHLWPLFSWLSIEDRCLSRCVEEHSTMSENGCESKSLLTRSFSWSLDLGSKAYNIVRVAATFNSPRFHDNPSLLYQQLLKVQLLESNRISSELEVIQDGQIYRAQEEPATVHITVFGDGVVILLPGDEQRHQGRFLSALPQSLAGWLMERPCECSDRSMFEMINALTLILYGEISLICEILDDQGFVDVPFLISGGI